MKPMFIEPVSPILLDKVKLISLKVSNLVASMLTILSPNPILASSAKLP